MNNPVNPSTTSCAVVPSTERDPSLRGWHVVATSDDLLLRHVFHARVGAYNLALWRSDDGQVNAWENRCPHRSVPLTMGINLGTELRCQYHGWRFATGTGECTTVPSQPAEPANRAACVNQFDCVESGGWIWVGLGQPGPFNGPLDVSGSGLLALRSLVMHVPAQEVVGAVAQALGGSLQALGQAGGAQAWVMPLPEGELRLHAQAQSKDSCVLHAQLLSPAEMLPAAALAFQQRFNQRMTRLRERLEQAAGARLTLALDEPLAIPLGQSEHSKTQRVRVASKEQTAQDITALKLVSAGGAGLRRGSAGAHIEVRTPNGLLRHYSLVNAPGETDSYLIGVKFEKSSRGGSSSLCAVEEGTELTVGLPINRFQLQSAAHTLLIAGGIGITPLLAMAQQLQAAGQRFALHYFVRNADHLAFAQRVQTLGASLVVHQGLDIGATQAEVARLLESPHKDHRVYVCGPGPMIDMVHAQALARGWDPARVHSEHFGNHRSTVHSDDRPVEVVFQRSGKTASVPAGRSIAAVAQDLGIEVSLGCEQGACGSCLTTVVSGEPDHRDVFLSEQERKSQRCMLVCVSRATTPSLVLDL